MKRQLSKWMIVGIMSISLLTGCGNSDLKDQNEKLITEVQQLTAENESLTAKVDELEKEIAKYKLEAQESNIVKEVFTIYTANMDSYEKEIADTVEIQSNVPITEKLDRLAKELSDECFDDLPIEVVGIKTVNDKQIATINLQEKEENAGKTEMTTPNWMYQYLQGSTGAAISTTSLLETFLQKDYAGKWIDGVEFLYNNEPIESQHTENLIGVHYR